MTLLLFMKEMLPFLGEVAVVPGLAGLPRTGVEAAMLRRPYMVSGCCCDVQGQDAVPLASRPKIPGASAPIHGGTTTIPVSIAAKDRRSCYLREQCKLTHPDLAGEYELCWRLSQGPLRHASLLASAAFNTAGPHFRVSSFEFLVCVYALALLLLFVSAALHR